jgi:pSer/pThr/pTyr-binding forkhead associated (FHA) protein
VRSRGGSAASNILTAVADRIVIDHVAGSRRGQRQEFAADQRIRFGRHPECEVSFDPHRDIDASSRHAELRVAAAGWVLVDLGSSNGTYADGHRVTETPIGRGVPVSIEFGPGGPRVRMFVGDDKEIAALPPAPVEAKRPRWLGPAIAGAIVVAVMVLAIARC